MNFMLAVITIGSVLKLSAFTTNLRLGSISVRDMTTLFLKFHAFLQKEECMQIAFLSHMSGGGWGWWWVG
jgi:hypothetical protein